MDESQSGEENVEIMIIEYVDDEIAEDSFIEEAQGEGSHSNGEVVVENIGSSEEYIEHNVIASLLPEASNTESINDDAGNIETENDYSHFVIADEDNTDQYENGEIVSEDVIHEGEIEHCEYLEEEYLTENCNAKTLTENNESTVDHETVIEQNVVTVHQISNAKDSSYECNECKVRFASETLLKYHRYKSKHDLPFVCYICNKKFNELNAFISHEEEHLSDTPYQCLDCKLMFKVPKELYDHRIIHLKTFACGVCLENCKSASELKRHEKMHIVTKLKMYKCKKCTATFFTEFGLQKHSKVHRFQCDKCGLVSPNMRYYKKHMATHKHITSFSCYICKDVFTSTAELSVHLKEHKDFEFQCMDCFKTFKEANDLEKHRVIHSSNAYIPILPKPRSSSDFKMVWKTN